MILRTPSAPVKTSTSCFRQVPWDRSSPERIAIDYELEPDHLARLVDDAVSQLDLSCLITSYAGTGSKAYPPGLMLRIVFYHLAIGEALPGRWAKACRENAPVKWLGFGITLSRSRLHAFQHRLAPHLDDWLKQNIALAVALGITTTTRGALDGSTIAANASRHLMLRRKTLDARLDLLSAAVVADEAMTELPTPRPWWMAKTPRGRRGQLERYRNARAGLGPRIVENSQRKSERRRDPEKIVIAPGDPEAVPGRDKFEVFRPLYNAQVIHDLDRELILGAEVFCQQNDAGTLRPMITTFIAWTGHAPSELLADSSYATVVDMRISAEFGTVLYAPYQGNDFSDRGRGGTRGEASGTSQAPKMFPKDRFVWDEASASSTCPAGHVMAQESSRTEPRAGDESVVRHIYRCPGERCAG
jgi:transposase